VFYKSEYRSVVALAAVLSGSRWAAQDLAPRGSLLPPTWGFDVRLTAVTYSLSQSDDTQHLSTSVARIVG
jgi:hypothetical protein